MGFRGITINLFGSLIINVRVNGMPSGNNILNIGVPHGGVVAPLLFLLYIIDMSTVCDTLS